MIKMDIRRFDELTTADSRSLAFTRHGLLTGAKILAVDAAEFQQRSIAAADLCKGVPDATRLSFERLRNLHAYGVLCYDAFTVVTDLRWVVLEQALRDRFVDFYAGSVPIAHKDGRTEDLQVAHFDELTKAFRNRGNYTRGWSLRLLSGATTSQMPMTLVPLLRWARDEGLLYGQRNKLLEQSVFGDSRNMFAHGSGYRLGPPNESARAIHETAEIINRLWGQDTSGGRFYPAPIQRDVLVIAWSPETGGHGTDYSVTMMRADQLAEDTRLPPDWNCLVVRGVHNDPDWHQFDARYERTRFPAELLWGSGDRIEAAAWLQLTRPTGDETTHLDRDFAVRVRDQKVDLPSRLEILLGAPKEQRPGTWHIVRADFPNDAHYHVRHLVRGEPCGEDDSDSIACPVEVSFAGTWTEASAWVAKERPGLTPVEWPWIHVPTRSTAPV
jgi:hypothetical protein